MDHWRARSSWRLDLARQPPLAQLGVLAGKPNSGMDWGADRARRILGSRVRTARYFENRQFAETYIGGD